MVKLPSAAELPAKRMSKRSLRPSAVNVPATWTLRAEVSPVSAAWVA